MKKESTSTEHYWRTVFRDFSPKYGLLGHQISYSLSPAIHRFSMKELGIAEDYRILDVPPQEIDEFFAHPHTKSMLGLNVTKPYKWVVAKKFAASSPVNTVYTTKETKHTANTDPLGFLKSLEANAFPIAATEQMIVFGGGGFAYAILQHLEKLHPKISKACITRSAVKEIRGVTHLKLNAGKELLDFDKEKPTVILHATSSNNPFLPMEVYKKLFLSFKHVLFMDANYGEKRTLIFDLLKTDMQCIDGLTLLVEQARESQLLWWNKTIDTAKITQHLQDIS